MVLGNCGWLKGLVDKAVADNKNSLYMIIIIMIESNNYNWCMFIIHLILCIVINYSKDMWMTCCVRL